MDGLLSLLFNVFLVIPGLPLAIVIAAYLPSGPLTLALVLIVTGWAWNARVLRAQTLALRQRDFVAAAIVTGESDFRIITREILPTMTSLLVAQVIGSTDLRDRRAGRARVPRARRRLGRDLGHEPVLGAERLGAAHRGVVDVRARPGCAWRSSASALTMLNSGFDEITNPRLQLERAWRAHLARRGPASPTRSTPVVMDRD